MAVLTATAGAPVFAAEVREAVSSEAQGGSPPAYAGVRRNGPDLASDGGAIYSPFATTSDVAGSTPHVHATATRHKADDESPGLVTATITVLVAAGILVALVRAIIAV